METPINVIIQFPTPIVVNVDTRTTGVPGPAIELAVNDGNIEWRPVGATAWTTLMPVADLAGDDGPAIELQVAAGYIEWRVVGGGAWTQLLAVSSLVGAAGPAIELQVSGGYIEWRVVGDAAWTQLLAVSSLVGAAGPAIELQVSGGYIQWRVVGAATWSNLVALSEITGPQGPAGPTAIVDDFYGAIAPGAGNEGTLYRCFYAGGTSFIIPTHASVPYALKTVLYARRMTSAGPVTISGAGVTINDNASADVPAGGLMAVIKVDEDVWDFI